MRRSAAAPVTASIRRIPEPMLRSPVMTKLPIWPDARQWVPPHSSWLKPSTRIVRTLSPYFSSKNASAPAAWASGIVIHSIDHRAVLADDAPHLALDRAASRRRSAPGRTGSRSGGSPGVTSEPACRARSPTTLRSARWSRCVPVWLRIVWARRSASTSAGTRVADARPAPWSTPRWTVSPAVCVPGDALDVLDVEQRPSPSAGAEHARCRRPGRRSRRRTASGRGRAPRGAAASARSSTSAPPRASRTRRRRAGSRRRGPRRRSSRSPGTRSAPVRPRMSVVAARGQRPPSARARPSCPRGSARAARRARPGTRRGRRATPYSAASSTVRSIGKPYVSWSRNATSPGSTGRVGGQVPPPGARRRAPPT